MSRICVKNLPDYVSEERLKDFFSRKGEVTDAKIMRTKEGKSRQFAFIGFRSEHEAINALNYFNKSFLDTKRITCEIAMKVGDTAIPRPWSRHSRNKLDDNKNDSNSSEPEKTVIDPKGAKKALGKNTKKTNNSNSKVSIDDDPLLQEFLQLVQPRNKSKMWANDTLAPPSVAQTQTVPTNKLSTGKSHKAILDEDVVKLDGIKKKGNESAEKLEVDKPNSLVKNEVLSDMDYFKSRVQKEWSDSETSDEEASANGSDVSDDDDSGDDSADGSEVSDDDSSADGSDDVNDVDISDQSRFKSSDVVDTPEPSVSEEKIDDGEVENIDPLPSSPKQEEVLQTSRLFIRNLPYGATEEELEELFRKFGSISQVHIVVDRDTKRSKGFAYVSFALQESASRALVEMDNSSFQGRLLHVMPAVSKNLPDKQENNKMGEQFSKTFKQKRDDERKESEASGNTRAWNSLFMRQDTVIENIARSFGVSKTDLLDKESNDLAVRIALGETQVIAATKKALSSAGVNVSSLEESAAGKTGLKRSDHVILVKNLPYGSSESELVDMFGKFGSLEKVILPPTKTLALVIFLERTEARTAFRGLMYKRFKDAPLYLEWAPANILSPVPTNGDNNADMGENAHRVSLEQQVEQITEEDIDPDRIESRSLYVKNLNFKTSDEALKEHFLEHIKGKGGKLLSVRVKKHLKNGKNVSMGFGFVEFDSADTAVRVCRDLQKTVLDGHALILQLCHAKKDDTLPKKTANDRSSTKLIVRNVAFEVTEKDLRGLFGVYGQIKRLRLPKKVENHRGFAFVEYVTKQEASKALQELSNTHLYGRHLVLERAKEGESLEELRARTAAQFTDSSSNLSRKRKHMTVLDEGNIKFKRIAE